MTSAPVRRLHEHATADGIAPLLEALTIDGAVIVNDLVDATLLAALDDDLRAAADGRSRAPHRWRSRHGRPGSWGKSSGRT